jgi:protein-L-isoaspartate(D-aspartate) O-methyltransferase
MDFKFARENMIKQQVMPEGIAIGSLINAMSRIAREDFLPVEYKNLAYCDTGFTVDGKKLKSPMLTAKLIYALDAKSNESVLKLGIECGYTTALLANVAERVEVLDYSDKNRNLVKQQLAICDIHNVELKDAEHLVNIIEEGKKYNCIYISNIVKEDELDESLFGLLEIGGRLVFTIKTDVCDRAYLTTRVDDKLYDKEFLFDIYK